jgi:outer membrane protein TolC
LSGAAVTAASEADAGATQSAADRIVESVAGTELRLLLEDVLDRNPELARLEAEAHAAAERVPQVKALPDPTASLTWYLMSPQTRVGPLEASVNITQSLPWFGTLGLEEQAALLDASASRFQVEAARLRLVTETRSAYHEVQFLDLERSVVNDDRSTLEHYAELALARYASGVGLNQAVIKIQAEITRAESRLLEIAARRAEVSARLNALRDRPQSTPIAVSSLGVRPAVELVPEELRRRALASRPEVAAATAGVEASAARLERTKKAYSPNLMFGVSYGFVGRREDEAGRLIPPEDNGQDTLGVTAGVSLPVWRAKLEAGVEEQTARRLAAEEAVREVSAGIDGDLGNLVERIRLLEDQVELYDGVLTVQARESLQSAESAYATGTAGALDLLDAERVLFQVMIGAARARTDLVIARSRLEGVIGGPLEVTP